MAGGKVSPTSRVLFGASPPTAIPGLAENSTYLQTVGGSSTGDIVEEFVWSRLYGWVSTSDSGSGSGGISGGPGILIVGTEIRLSIGTLPQVG